LMRTHAAKSVSGVRQLRRSATQPAMGPGRDDGMVVVHYQWSYADPGLAAGGRPPVRPERPRPSSATRGQRRATSSARFETAAPIGGTAEEQL
jgi:hypothetical protein